MEGPHGGGGKSLIPTESKVADALDLDLLETGTPADVEGVGGRDLLRGTVAHPVSAKLHRLGK